MRAVLALLELGADPNAGSRGTTPLGALNAAAALPAEARQQIAELLLLHGADCLAPAHHGSSTSVVAHLAVEPGKQSTAALMLAHLEGQRAAGQLHLGSAAREAQLLLAATRQGHQQLFSHSLRCLEERLDAPGGSAAVEAPSATTLGKVLVAAIRDRSSSAHTHLQQLLASRLSLLRAASCSTVSAGRSLIMVAALTSASAAAKVRLLHAAGAPLTATDLLHLVDRRSAPGLAAMLSAGRPAVDTSHPGCTSKLKRSYSCPIHRALHSQVGCWFWPQLRACACSSATACLCMQLPAA